MTKSTFYADGYRDRMNNRPISTPAANVYKNEYLNETMNKHGDEVLQYIEDALGELPKVDGLGWGQMACAYVSTAVELWASSIESELESLEDEAA